MGGRNRGQVIIMFVLALVVLLGFVALGIDVGYMYSLKNDLQRSADAGALAGAYIFHNGGWVTGQDAPGTLRADAMDRALSFATQDPVGAAQLVNADVSFKFPYDDDDEKVNQIEVRVDKNVNLFFAGAIGFPNVPLYAIATAEAIPVDQNVECLTPLAFPYPYIDLPSPTPPFTPNKKWDPGELLLPISQGLQVTFQVANTPSSLPAIPGYVQNWAGEIFPLTLCSDDGSDSPLINRIIDPCWDGCNAISINDTVNPKPHQTYNPTINTINGSIIFRDPQSGVSWDSGSNLPVSDAYPGDDWLYSPRVMRVILYDPQETAPGGSHPGVIKVDRFAGFWVWNADNSGGNRIITGYLIPDSAVGGESAFQPIAPSLKTTRLIPNAVN